MTSNAALSAAPWRAALHRPGAVARNALLGRLRWRLALGLLAEGLARRVALDAIGRNALGSALAKGQWRGAWRLLQGGNRITYNAAMTAAERAQARRFVPGFFESTGMAPSSGPA